MLIAEVDSIVSLIGKKEAELNKEVFFHFRNIQEICNHKQKETFKKILDDAHKVSRQNSNMPPPQEATGNHRPPPPPDGGNVNRRPPPDNGIEKH